MYIYSIDKNVTQLCQREERGSLATELSSGQFHELSLSVYLTVKDTGAPSFLLLRAPCVKADRLIDSI